MKDEKGQIITDIYHKPTLFSTSIVITPKLHKSIPYTLAREYAP